ncbi:thioesterase domain-containing protein [Nocardia sp. NPDC058497]|uniref:thioesterase domain-containing protein n=1 Tax=Nocardia sp. NPDC058497 TaxID=3346529 RepID=UPI0036684F15
MSIHADSSGTGPGPACAWSPDRPDSCLAVAAVDGGRAGSSALAVVLPIRPRTASTDGAPLFWVAGEAGLAWNYAGLVAHIDPRVPIYGLQAVDGPAPRTIREYAVRYVAEIRRIAPRGPYQLLGSSVGGFVAHEIAVLLRAAGDHVRVVLLDADPGAHRAVPPQRLSAGEYVARFGPLLGVETDTAQLTADETAAVVVAALAGTLELTGADLDRLADAADTAARMVAGHRPSLMTGDLTVCVADRASGAHRLDPEEAVRNWKPHVEGTITGYVLDAAPDELTAPESLPEIAHVLDTTRRRR